jgi:putative Ca2+/H+ antiporter (TMEM165/GDT1 family)
MTASVFVLTYGAVFAAELVGDKLLYTASALTARYRAIPIMCGATLAFVVKMGAAVLVGEAVSRIPPIFLAGVTTVSFLWVAHVLWKKPYGSEAARGHQDPSNGVLMSFAILLFSEWGDLGQVTTATMAARFGSPVAVWIGAVCAMTSKAVLGALLGVRVRKWLRYRVSPRTVRYGSVMLLLLLAGLSVAELLLGFR